MRGIMADFKRLKGFDVETGEIVDELPVYFAPKRKNGFDEWAAMGLLAQKQVALSGLDGFTVKVYLYLTSLLDFENDVVINQSEIAREFNTKQPNVSKAIKSLVDFGILVKRELRGNIRSYRFNPNYVWRGSAKNHHKAIREQEDIEARKKLANIVGVINCAN